MPDMNALNVKQKGLSVYEEVSIHLWQMDIVNDWLVHSDMYIFHSVSDSPRRYERVFSSHRRFIYVNLIVGRSLLCRAALVRHHDYR
jgi:hypothetical protein